MGLCIVSSNFLTPNADDFHRDNNNAYYYYYLLVKNLVAFCDKYVELVSNYFGKILLNIIFRFINFIPFKHPLGGNLVKLLSSETIQ